MGFLIPSLEQCRYLRRYKRQRRLEREAAAAASVADATTAQNNNNTCNADNANQNAGHSNAENGHPNRPQRLSSNRDKRRDSRKRTRRHDNNNDDLSVGSESAAASHISDFWGESQALEDGENGGTVDGSAKNADQRRGDQECHNGTVGDAAAAEHMNAPSDPDDDNVGLSQPDQENTQSSSATEQPPVNESIKIRHKGNLSDPNDNHHNHGPEQPSKMAVAAAAAAANFLAADSREPASQEMPPPTAKPERHPSRTTSYADTSGMTISVPDPTKQQQQETFHSFHKRAPAPSRHNSNGVDDDATDFGGDTQHQLPSSFVITSPHRQAESQGTVSPMQSPVEAFERLQRQQYEERRRQQLQQPQQKAAAAAPMQQQPLTFPKKRTSCSSGISGTSKPWFQKKKRKPKMSQTTLSFRGGSN